MINNKEKEQMTLNLSIKKELTILHNQIKSLQNTTETLIRKYQ